MNDRINLKEYNVETGQYEDAGTVSARSVGKGVDEESLLSLLEAFLNSFASGYNRGLTIGSLAVDAGMHRTLQGQLVNFALGILEGYASKMDLAWTDPRNHTAAIAAHKIKSLLDAGELPKQPFI